MLRTAKRKALCRECPVARTADLVGDSVMLLIVRDLLGGPKRFGQLNRSLRGVSSRTLALKLRQMRACGFVSAPVPAYALTRKGKALRPIVGAMRRYGEKYL